MNVFQMSYDNRLQGWYDLRTRLKDLTIEEKCVEIDKWWQRAPLINHHLHTLDTKSWPDPWELLAENIYCDVAKALGMCYTLLLLDVSEIELVEARNEQAEDVILVLVDNAKYILNYWPDTVLSNKLSNFKIVKKIDINNIKRKIG